MEQEVRAAKRKIKSFLRERDFQSVLEACQDLCANGVESAEIMTYKGVSEFHLGLHEEAAASYELALVTDVDRHDALKGLAQCLLHCPQLRPLEVKLSTFQDLLQIFPDIKGVEMYRKLICIICWDIGDYPQCFDVMHTLDSTSLLEVVQKLIPLITREHSTGTFTTLNAILIQNQDLVEGKVRLKYYHEYAVHLNRAGRDPTEVTSAMVEILSELCPRKGRIDSGMSSLGSDDVGVEVAYSSAEWLPAQTLTTQIWGVWKLLAEEWIGSPSIYIPEVVYEEISVTLVLLGKDTCHSKTIANLLLNMGEGRYEDALQVMEDKMSSSKSPDLVLLWIVASAALHKNTNKIRDTLKDLEQTLSSQTTYSSRCLLELVKKLHCYLAYTLHLPLETAEFLETGSEVAVAWGSLLNNDPSAILTCDNRHPMVDAVKEYVRIMTGRNGDYLKLLQIRQNHPNNLLYNHLFAKALRKVLEKETIERGKYEELLSQCYCTDNFNPTILHYLGDLHRSRHDHVEAAKFYKRSIKLEPSLAVLQQLDSLPQSHPEIRRANIRAHSAVAKVVRDHKLYLRLSMLCEDKPNISIEYLQKAISISKDPLIYELLGENYLKLGKYNSAYKAFYKTNEMRPSAYCQYKLADILCSLGRPSEALAQFQEVLEEQPKYGPALLGCVKSLHQLILDCLSSARYPHAVFLANELLVSADRLVQQEPRWSCVWKILGDTCLLLTNIRDASLVLPPALVTLLEQEEHENVSKDRLIHLTIACYARGHTLSPKTSEYLSDLARSYLALSDHESGYLLHASELAKRAVTSSPRDHLAWNLLGVVCIKQKSYKLAQHALVSSLNVTKDDNPEAWTNLGILYMLNKEYELSNKCYAEAQSNDPKYAPCWVAQAYLARIMGYDRDSDKLFRDLVRDVTRDETVEGTLGFATKLKSDSVELIHELLTISLRCTHFAHADTWLLHFLSAQLLEQLHLHSSSLQHLLRAYSLAPDLEQREQVQIHMDRVQCQLGNFSALSNTESSLWSALALSKLGKYGMASSVLDNMIGQDVSVFQAVLCWQSKDKKTAASFLQHADSDAAKLIKCLVLDEEPGEELELKQEMETKPDSIQAKYTCVKLAQYEGDNIPEELPVSPGSLYLQAKYLACHKRDPGRVKELVGGLLRVGFIKEDLLEMMVDSFMWEKNTGEDRGETEEEIREEGEWQLEAKRWALRSIHMFPWRKQSCELLAWVQAAA